MKMPAYNGRFGVMAAVDPQKRQCKFGSLYPAGSLVEAATTPSRSDGRCTQVGGQCTTKVFAKTCDSEARPAKP